MKKIDILVILIVIIVLLPFFLWNAVYVGYKEFNAIHPLLMAFLKFAILATFGEMLGLRVKTGRYTMQGFGLLLRSVIWGILGIWIAIAMGIFRNGVPIYFSQFKLFNGIQEAMTAPFSVMKLCGAFLISVMMNTAFAPVFMTLHKITDAHILRYRGKVSALFKPLNMAQSFAAIDWKVQWGFVFKKSIPLFWIPAHTLTFILPIDFQVLFAAFCSIILGLILSIAARKI
jgi:hypothetical protein